LQLPDRGEEDLPLWWLDPSEAAAPGIRFEVASGRESVNCQGLGIAACSK
jgi:hypothetical protein